MPSVSERDTLRTVEEKLAELAAQNTKLQAERDEYKKLYLQMLELCRKLERGLLALLRRNEATLKADWNWLWPDQGSAPSDRSDRGSAESRISAGRKLATDGRQDLDGVHGGVTWTMSWTLEHRTDWFSSSNELVLCSAIRNERRRLPRMRWDFLGRATERAWNQLPRVLAEQGLLSFNAPYRSTGSF